MKLSELFEGAGDIKDLEIAIRKYCPENFKAMVFGDAPFLFRSTNQAPFAVDDDSEEPDPEFLVVQKRTSPRVSATGNNFTLNFVSESPLWKGIPKRSLSSSVSANYGEAQGFGDYDYLAIPFDSVNNFAVSNQDFNMLEVKGGQIIERQSLFTNFFRRIGMLENDRVAKQKLASILGDDSALVNYLRHPIMYKIPSDGYTSFPHLDFKELTSLLELGDLIIKEVDRIGNRGPESDINKFDTLYDAVAALIKDGLDGSKSLLTWFNTNITPTGLGISSYKSIWEMMAIEDDSEVWFEGGWLGIKLETARSFPASAHWQLLNDLQKIAQKL